MTRLAVFALACAPALFAWGVRGHREANRAAIRALPDDGPVFLKAHEEYIGFISISPDSWRLPSEPFAKVFEDPNHGWFQEQAPALMKNPPRSRYEFILALYREHLKTRDKLTNVRWTGTLPYAAAEAYERIKAGMRRYRMMKRANEDTRFAELEIATHAGHLGHYIADSANPMHDSIHHDGWVGDNPKGYATDAPVHGRFESAFVDLIGLEMKDFMPTMAAPKVLSDPFRSILGHIEVCYGELENVYSLDKEGAFRDKDHERGRAVVYKLLAQASTTLRDLIHTAWVESAAPFRFDRANNPVDPKHPKYDPATGYAAQGNLVP